MTTTKEIKKTREDFGYSLIEQESFFRYNISVPKGSFSIRKRSGKYYWYYQLQNYRHGEKTRVKYICPTFEGLNEENKNSFQVCIEKLIIKSSNDFSRTTSQNTKITTLIDDFIQKLFKEENDPYGIRKQETTTSLRTTINQFKIWMMDKDYRFNDIVNPKKLKDIIKEYLEYLKIKPLPSGGVGLTRNSRRTYMKSVKQFFTWLEDEDIGLGILPTNPISSEFLKKIDPYNPNHRQGHTTRNTFYTSEGYSEMLEICVEKVGDYWRDFIKNGHSRKHRNQPLGVGSDIVYFISLLQLDSGFRLGEVLTSYRSKEYWDLRKDKKNSSTFWNKINGEWFLFIWWKNKESKVPMTTNIRSWDKPKGVDFKTTKNKKGKELYYDTNIIDVCMKMWRDSPFLFGSPNYKSKFGHYSKTQYSNTLKHRIIHKGEGSEGFEKYGVMTSHDFRDYFITHKLNEGFSPYEVSKITRHSIQTLEKYYERIDLKGQLNIQKRLDKTRIIKGKNR